MTQGHHHHSCFFTQYLSRFLYLKHDSPHIINVWNTKLQEYIHHGQIPEEPKLFIQHVKSMEHHTLQDQLQFLSSISNYHWWQYIRCDGTKSKSGIHVRLTDHLLYHPYCEETDEVLKLKYIPESPRNRLMYFQYTEGMYPGALRSSIVQLLKLDNCEENVINDDVPEGQPSNKRKKYATHVLKVSPQQLCDKMGVKFSTIKNSTDQNRNLYTTFSQQLITDGIIQWRKHSDNADTVIMSDYNCTTGNLSPLSYVHVTCTTGEANSQNVLLRCTCHIYNTIQCAGLSEIELSNGEDAVLDETMTCMHCRFFKEHLLKYRSSVYNITSTSIVDSKVKSSLDLVNNPVVVIGMASQNSTTKFSVTHEDVVAMVHINFNQANSCFAKCQNGECTARLQNKKKIPKAIGIEQSQSHCGHIQTLFANFEIVTSLFPDFFATGSDDEESEDAFCSDDFRQQQNTDVNIEDDLVDRVAIQDNDKFDVNTGCWKFSAKSDHKPKDMTDLLLTRFDFYMLNQHIYVHT